MGRGALTLILQLCLIILVSRCADEGMTNFATIGGKAFKPTTRLVTALNDGWFEILLKDDKLEIRIYLPSLTEGTYTLAGSYYSGIPVPKNYAIARVSADEKSYFATSGGISISGVSEIGGSFYLEALEIQQEQANIIPPGTLHIVGGKLNGLPVTALVLDGCRLTKIGVGTSFRRYIYGSDGQIALAVAESRLDTTVEEYHYNDGALWPASYASGNLITARDHYRYQYDSVNRLKGISGVDAPIGSYTFSYSSDGNLHFRDYLGTSMTLASEHWEYSQYDSHPNPYRLLAKSIALPFFITYGGAVEMESLSVNNVLERTSRIGTYYYPGQEVEKSETLTYEYDGFGYPTMATVNNGEQVVKFEYLGCK